MKIYLCLELIEASCVAAKAIRIYAEMLKHSNEEIAQRFVLHGVEGEVLAMFETATGEENG